MQELGRPFSVFLGHFTSMTADLTLLLATLSIMTGAFVITGVPTKLGFLLMEAAGVNLLAMLVLAGTLGLTFSIHGRHSDGRAVDMGLRVLLAGCSIVPVVHPNATVAALAVVPIALLTGYWFVRSRRRVVVYAVHKA